MIKAIHNSWCLCLEWQMHGAILSAREPHHIRKSDPFARVPVPGTGTGVAALSLLHIVPETGFHSSRRRSISYEILDKM